MHTTNYQATLILPSPDCPASAATVPGKAGTVAAMQHERLQAAPYGLTSDDLVFGIFADRNGIADSDRPGARAEFFSKGQPCLRSSPLVKTFGWAIHHDAQGQVALVDPASATFAELAADRGIKTLAGMRSKRA